MKLDNNEDKDEYLEKKYTNNQLTIKINPKVIFIQNKIPKYVATPFPPLNFNQTGKTCPINTDKAEM